MGGTSRALADVIGTYGLGGVVGIAVGFALAVLKLGNVRELESIVSKLLTWLLFVGVVAGGGYLAATLLSINDERVRRTGRAATECQVAVSNFEKDAGEFADAPIEKVRPDNARRLQRRAYEASTSCGLFVDTYLGPAQ